MLSLSRREENTICIVYVVCLLFEMLPKPPILCQDPQRDSANEGMESRRDRREIDDDDGVILGVGGL